MKAAMIVGLAALCLTSPISAARAVAEDHEADESGIHAQFPMCRSGDGDRDDDAPAGLDNDQNCARELVEHGVIRPLSAIIRRVKTITPGEVIGIEFAHDSLQWIYIVTVLTRANKRVELAIDAETLALLPRAGR